MTAGLTFALIFGWLLTSSTPPKSVTPPIDFSRDIRPILSNHCLKCHGPDDKQRAAGLRLDTFEGASKLLSNGKRAIVPAKPRESELLRRVHTTGPLLMPPVTANKPLSDEQKSQLNRWITSGARYKQHWSFVPPNKSLLRASH
jgi:hypothetical protein